MTKLELGSSHAVVIGAQGIVESSIVEIQCPAFISQLDIGRESLVE